jgi:hypothetical protein
MNYALNIVPEDFQDIARAAKRAWGSDTSENASWTSEQPESGQALVTALLVQDGYGGVVKEAVVNGASHYWNEVDGVTVDLTRSQFPKPLFVEDEAECAPESLLARPAVAERYASLKNRVII